MSKSVRAIHESEQPRRQWQVRIDGELLPRPSLVEISSRYGTLRYGWTAGGYDAWSFREPDGGGVVIVPFALADQRLLVGVIEQQRPFQGGKVLNVPRGLHDPGEQHAVAAKRELLEETGLRVDPVELDGERVNIHSSFFETENAGDGARFFACELSAEWLERSGEHWTVKSEHVSSDPKDVHERSKERIDRLLFLPWTEAAMLGDMFTVAAVGKLAATLQRHGRTWR